MGNTSKLVSGDGLERSTSRQPPKVSCPRCDSNNTKFCYYNNYSRSQPRHFCKSCRRHWTNGGTLRNVPVGGGRKNKKRPKTTHYSSSSTTTNDGGISYISEIVKRQPMWFAPNNTDGLHPPPPPSSSRYLNNSSSSHNTRRSGNILRSFLASLPPVSPLLDPSLSSTYSFLPFARNIEGEVAAGDGYGKVQNSAGNGYYGLGDPSWQKTATTTTKTPLIPTCSFANLTGFEFSSTTGGGGGGGGPVSGTGGTGGYWASCWDELGGFSSFPTCNGFP